MIYQFFQISTSLDISELITASSKIQHVISITDATQFVEKGTVWRKLLDSSLYDLSKWMISKYPYEFEPKNDHFKAFFDIVFDAWCGSFEHFESMKSTLIEYSTKRMSFLAYMRWLVKKNHLLMRRRQDLKLKKLHPVSDS